MGGGKFSSLSIPSPSSTSPNFFLAALPIRQPFNESWSKNHFRTSVSVNPKKMPAMLANNARGFFKSTVTMCTDTQTLLNMAQVVFSSFILVDGYLVPS